MPNRPAHAIALAHPDRIILEAWARRRKTAQALSLRARIILACGEPAATNSGVARALGVSRPTVRRGDSALPSMAPTGSWTSLGPEPPAASAMRTSSG
jgi:hypothetical protein